MRVLGATIRGYTLALKRPLHTARGELIERRGMLLALEDERGHRGLGDAAPLPGFSEDTLEQAADALQRAIAATSPLRETTISSAVAANELLERLALPPAAAHALDQALLDLLARRQGCPLSAVLADRRDTSTPELRTRIPVHALVSGAEDARLAVQTGYGTLKVKVGMDSVSADEARVATIREAVGSAPRLRLDANGAWDEQTALAALQRLARYGVHCVEQPTAADRIDVLARVRAASPVPIAADESARSANDIQRLVAQRAADAVVIKPMLCGGLQQACQLGCLAADAGLAVSVTTCFESGIGRLGAIHLAAALPGDLWSCGLCTDELLTEDLVAGPKARGGQLVVSVKDGLGSAADAMGR